MYVVMELLAELVLKKRYTCGNATADLNGLFKTILYHNLIHVYGITCLITYMKKLLASDWLRAVQFKCNTSAAQV